MKKNWIIASFMAGLSLQVASAQGSFIIGSQSHVVCNGSPAIVLQNTGFDNDGHFEAGNSAVNFSGAPATVSGSTETTFFDLHLGTTVALKSNIAAQGAVLFYGGMLLPDDQTLSLAGDGGNFYFENDNSRMAGSGKGYATIYTKLLAGAENSAGPGNIGLLVQQSEAEDYAEFRRGYAPQSTPAGSSIARWYEVLPAYNQNLNAQLRFWYLDAELGGLDENELLVWRSNDGGNTWSPLPLHARNTSENWVEIAGQDELARYTLAGPENIQPLAGSMSEKPAMRPGFALEIFPNPVSETAQIRIQVAEPTRAFLRWQDASGKVVRNTPIMLSEGRNNFSEPVSELPAGVWFVSVGLPGVPAIRVVKE